MLQELVLSLLEELNMLEERIAFYDQKLEEIYQHDERCQQLATIPGVGKIVATAMIASIGNAQAFENSRQLSAWLGLVPAQYSTGGKQYLVGISKRGDQYLRKLLVHGARSVINWIGRKKEKTQQDLWVVSLVERRGKNCATVALANKIGRIIWAVLRTSKPYRPHSLSIMAS